MDILINVSLGELIDKITILEIKQSKIADKNKLVHVNTELQTLEQALKFLNINGKSINLLKEDLLQVNLKLWGIEDAIRLMEKNSLFNDEFIQLARSVYKVNDKRFTLKSKINKLYDSNIKEVKSYEEY